MVALTRLYITCKLQEPDIDPSDPEQQQAALLIQTKYRQFSAKKTVEEMKREQAAVKIQSGYRGMHDRNRVKSLK